MNRIRVFLIAVCIIAVTPRLPAEIILLSRLSDEQVCAWGLENGYCPPPQTQTDYSKLYRNGGLVSVFNERAIEWIVCKGRTYRPNWDDLRKDWDHYSFRQRNTLTWQLHSGGHSLCFA